MEKLVSVVLFVVLLLSLTACGTETEPSPVREEQGPHLVFEDHFDGDHLDPSKWELCPEWPRKDINHWYDSMTSLDGNGYLVIGCRRNEETGILESGGIRTKGIFEYGLGYYEASVRLPLAKGIWGAFWLIIGNMNDPAAIDGTSVDGCEIDIVESIYNERGLADNAIHWDGYGDGTKSLNNQFDPLSEHGIDVYDGEFHTFGVWRSELEYVFYIDGVEVWSTEATGICTEKGYMVLSVEAAAWAGAGTDDANALLPVTMEVDWVKVWDDIPF